MKINSFYHIFISLDKVEVIKMVAEDLSDFLKTILLFIVFVAFFKEKTKNIVLQKVAESRSKNLKSKKSTAKKKSVASSRVVSALKNYT